MEIREIARKLYPLMPYKISKWMRILDRVGHDDRAAIEKSILIYAERYLGDYRNNLILTLPSPQQARGPINLGTILYEQEKWPLGISKEEMTRNMAIFGMSGAGKTNAAFHILIQLMVQKVPFLFLDWKRTARHLIPTIKDKLQVFTPGRPISPFPFNPFIAPPGLEDNVYINQVVDVMADAFTLGDGSRRILQKALESCYQSSKAPTIEDVINCVEEMEDKARIREWKISTLRALETLQFSKVSSPGKMSQEQLINQLLHKNTIIEMDSLPQGVKKFIIPLLAQWIFYVKMNSQRREKLELVIFVEEAHHVLYKSQRSRETLMNQLLRQCREMGIAYIVVDQHPHLISDVVLGNCYTSICLNQKNPSDINKAAGLSLIQDHEKHHLSRLKTGHAIVKLQDRWTEPILVEIPHVELRKGAITDGLLQRYLKGNRTLSKELRSLKHKSDTVRLNPGLVVSTPGTLPFLRDVLDHPDSGVNDRYKRLCLSVGTGYRLYHSLIDHGLIEDSIVKVGNTRKVILRLTQKAKQLVDFDGTYHGGLIHEFWKKYYYRLFRHRGYIVQLEANSPGGPIDLLVQNANESIAVEIETGKSDVVKNVSQALRNGHAALVVATDRKAFQNVQRRLTEASLWPSERVRIVLRDKLP